MMIELPTAWENVLHLTALHLLKLIHQDDKNVIGPNRKFPNLPREIR